jgi:hypothetical protein
MKQILNRFNAEQVKVLLFSSKQGAITLSEIENKLCIGKPRLFALLKQY